MTPGGRRRAAELVLVAALLAAETLLLYGPIVRLWWTSDDLFHLHRLTQHPALSYYVSPSVWRELSFRMFTPLLFSSYGLDLSLFGFEPAGFYAHALLALWAAALAVSAALGRWLPPGLAALGGALFLAGPPTVSWAIPLMLRHYTEGLALASLAVWAFVGAVRHRSRRGAWLSAALYLAASLAKEVYVPLPVLLACLPEGSFSDRRRALRPHVAALVAYFLWRRVLIGTFLGGYGWVTLPGELPAAAAALPRELWRRLLGPGAAGAAVLGAVLVAALAVLLFRRRLPAALALGAAFVLLAPIVPVVKLDKERFAVLPWLFAAAVLLFGVREIFRFGRGARGMAAALVVAAAGAALAGNRLAWKEELGRSRRMSAEGRFFLSMAPGDLLRSPAVPPAAREETRWFREEYRRRPPGAGWFDDDFYLCAARPSGRIWEYEESEGRIRDVTESALFRAGIRCDGWKRGAPLRASLSFSGTAFFWDFGPYAAGKYAILRNRGAEATPVDRVGGYQLATPAISLMVRYESAAGWVTYSPELTLDSRVAAKCSWERRLAGR